MARLHFSELFKTIRNHFLNVFDVNVFSFCFLQKSLYLLKLESGWVSAMAQGHGISMMVRAAQVTADASYWTAAQRALSPFKKLTHEGGVRNNIMGIYPWFEEYPFTEGMIRFFLIITV